MEKVFILIKNVIGGTVIKLLIIKKVRITFDREASYKKATESMYTCLFFL